jgi:DNA-binding transcriptional regulator YdaS (Cro superfamily)
VALIDLIFDFQEEDVMVTPIGNNGDPQLHNGLDARERPSPTWGRLPDPDYVDKSPQNQNAASTRKIRAQKALGVDALTQIRREELRQWDQEYLQKMSRLGIQKAYARGLAQARKNAMSWISGRGIGAVGMGVGLDGVSHPLESFCGEALLIALSNEQPATKQGRKRSSSGASDEEGRNVRPRITDGELEVGLAHPDGLGGQQEVSDATVSCYLFF